ncbi:winged helix-turn-helix domain-containing protein [Streptomyces phaeochromogenes]|uniref:helix-turn-helix domain-containing protein n=1 Tax=Streptomyces phaeochromogenes TaxID=1923 RepID=UPI00386E4451
MGAAGAGVEARPLAHGWKDEGQGWTLKRIKLLIGRLFHVGYTVQGVWKLMNRHGWSAQVPVRRALERDEGPSRCGRNRCGRW